MALTADQLAKLKKADLRAKMCVEIAATSPLRYCSGQNPVTVDANVYSPRFMSGDRFSLVNPEASKARIMIDDGDRTVRTAWYSDPFSGYVVTFTMLLREPNERAWSTSVALAWYCDHCEMRGNKFELHLRSSYGHRQRFGLLVGNRTLFPKAPEPWENFRFASGATSVPSGGGSTLTQPSPYAELYGTASSMYWSFIDPTGQMAFEAGLDKPYWISQENWDALSGESGNGGGHHGASGRKAPGG